MKPLSLTATIAFNAARTDIHVRIDKMTELAHFEIWCKHKLALKLIRSYEPPAAPPLAANWCITWLPIVPQSWFGRLLGRVRDCRRLSRFGYSPQHAWYIASKFN